MNSLAGGTSLNEFCKFCGVHFTYQHQVRRNVRWHQFECGDQVFDTFARPVGGRAGNCKCIGGNADLVQIRGGLRIPFKLVALVYRDWPSGWHAQKGWLHFKKPAANSISDTDNSVDSWIQVALPRHRVEKTQVANTAAVGNDLDRQAFCRMQAVCQCAAVERVYEVVLTANEFRAQRCTAFAIKVLLQRDFKHGHTRFCKCGGVRMTGRADNGNFHANIVHANKRRDGRSVAAFCNTQ